MKTIFVVYRISYMLQGKKLVAGLGEQPEPAIAITDHENSIVEGVPDKIDLNVIRNIEMQHQAVFTGRMEAMEKDIKYLRVTVVNVVILDSIPEPFEPNITTNTNSVQ